MLRRKVCVSVFIFLFVAQVFSNLYSNNPLDEKHEASSSKEVSSDDYGDTTWFEFHSPTQSEVDVHRSSGVVRLASVQFDPLIEQAPTSLYFPRLNDGFTTGLFLLQLHERNGDVLLDLSEEFNFQPLELISDSVWLVRANPSSISTFTHIEHQDIRWVGHMQPEWRIHPRLLESTTPLNTQLSLIPAPDVSNEGLSSMVLDILSSGATAVTCGTTHCLIDAPASSLQQIIKRIAYDGRALWVEPSYSLHVHNSDAITIAGVQGVINNATFTLDGSGEMIAITDTGLDRDHPDIDGRVAAVYTQFGLDTSSADTNSGHGTHIALTVLGDGTNDSSMRGMAPEAQLVMYALEHDPTGVFGRLGSIYDMLKDAERATARVAVNAWGLNGNYGQYTADARSVDIFMNDYPEMIPFFSIGDRGGEGSSQVTSPGTAKNVISIGASTTGTSGSTSLGEVASFSSEGPSLDGRIKPDLVAPGVNICSGRAEEALIPSGTSCGSGTHANGKDLYMMLSGTSQSTAVASGVGALLREYLREQQSIFSPSGSLIKASLINGATDLGTSDIPNEFEGWGQINLEQSIMPTSGTTSLDQFYDDKRMIRPGFALSYPFSLRMDEGVDITLVWSDAAGSANAPQNEARLVNDLDLILEGPNGEQYLGNVFANGFSTSGGSSDQLNNVERIRIAPGTLSGEGNWVLKVEHRGGLSQKFSLVMSAIASPISIADLTVYDGSIVLSSTNPLRNDLISISLTFTNQGTLASGTHNVKFEDITDGVTLLQTNRSSLEPGGLDAMTIYHSFSSTGIHTLRLSLDLLGQVDEINDEQNGTNNNIIDLDVEVMALGVRVLVANDDGTIPQTQSEKENNSLFSVDVTQGPSVTVPLVVLHEGTGNQSVDISASMVQVPNAERPDLLEPSQDQWQRTFLGESSLTMSPQGTDNDTYFVDLELLNLDSDFTDTESPRFIRAGTYVVDITVRYEFQPTVAHTQRVTLEVPQYDDVLIASAGTNDLSAQPGQSVVFSISVKNIGNAPSQYSVSCESESRWQIMLGDSNSSQLDFEPLDLQEFLPMSIRIFIPPVAGGLPSAGTLDTITCYVTSLTDESMNHTEIVQVTVDPIDAYSVQLGNEYRMFGPSSLEDEVAVDTGELVYMNLTVANQGNRDTTLKVKVIPATESWIVQLADGDVKDSRELQITLSPGQSKIIGLIFGVPEAAEEGDENTFIIRTEKTSSDYRSNTTLLVVKDELALDLTGPSGDIILTTIADDFTYGDYIVTNIGNTPLNLEWSNNLVPDGWTIGFSNPVTYLLPRETATVRLGIMPPPGAEVSQSSFNLQVFVTGTSLDRSTITSVNTSVGVVSSMYGNFSLEEEGEKPFQLVGVDSKSSTTVLIRNDGNVPLTAELSAEILDKNDQLRDDWEVSLSIDSVDNLAVGQSITVEITATPKEGVANAKAFLHLNLSNNAGTMNNFVLDMTADSSSGDSGFFTDLPAYVSVPVAAIVVVTLAVLARRMKKSGELNSGDTELLYPETFAHPEHLESRREEALDIDHAVNKMASGEVSSDEIQQAILQSMDAPVLPSKVPQGLPPGMAALPSSMPPSMSIPAGMPPAGMPPATMPPTNTTLPPLPQPRVEVPTVQQQGPPLPPGGLPSGWTMEQWIHYGHQWLERNS